MRRWELYLVGRGWRMELEFEGDDVIVETEYPELLKTAFRAAPAALFGEGLAVEVRRSPRQLWRSGESFSIEHEEVMADGA